MTSLTSAALKLSSYTLEAGTCFLRILGDKGDDDGTNTADAAARASILTVRAVRDLQQHPDKQIVCAEMGGRIIRSVATSCVQPSRANCMGAVADLSALTRMKTELDLHRLGQAEKTGVPGGTSPTSTSQLQDARKMNQFATIIEIGFRTLEMGALFDEQKAAQNKQIALQAERDRRIAAEHLAHQRDQQLTERNQKIARFLDLANQPDVYGCFDSDPVLSQYTCAMTFVPARYPVRDPHIPHDPTKPVYYERAALKNWVTAHGTSPTTTLPLNVAAIVACPVEQAIIDARLTELATSVSQDWAEV
jgi:hypothetical protein